MAAVTGGATWSRLVQPVKSKSGASRSPRRFNQDNLEVNAENETALHIGFIVDVRGLE